jgi:hypothetical protein
MLRNLDVAWIWFSLRKTVRHESKNNIMHSGLSKLTTKIFPLAIRREDRQLPLPEMDRR